MLFSVDSKFQSDLDSNNISEELRRKFENNEISLSPSATVSDNSWQITDEDKRYIIRKDTMSISSHTMTKIQCYFHSRMGIKLTPFSLFQGMNPAEQECLAFH